MSNENQITFNEAPSSINFRFTTRSGFVAQLTIRGQSGYEVLQKAEATLQKLLEEGCQPYPIVPMNNTQENTNSNEWCQIHAVEMKQWSKGGKTWHSHSTENGWCYGK